MNRKHGLALLWSVLLCLGCLCACGEEPHEAKPEPPAAEQTPEAALPEQPTQEEPPETPEDAVFSVSFGEYIVQYTLPATWEGLYAVHMQLGTEDNYEVGFYHKASAEFGGWLFSLALFTDDEYRQFPETTVVTQDGTVTLVCMRPSDVQFDLDYAAEYLAMSEEIDSILTSVRLLCADGERGETS